MRAKDRDENDHQVSQHGHQVKERLNCDDIHVMTVTLEFQIAD